MVKVDLSTLQLLYNVMYYYFMLKSKDNLLNLNNNFDCSLVYY